MDELKERPGAWVNDGEIGVKKAASIEKESRTARVRKKSDLKGE